MRSRYLILFSLCLVGAIALNGLAFFHARAMLKYTDVPVRTESPEDLDLISKLKVLLTGVKIPRPRNTRTPNHYSLNHDTHRFAGANGVVLEAWHLPVADANVLVLLFHGYSSSKDSLLPIANQLHEMGISTLLVDFNGSGGSESSDTTIGYMESIDVDMAYAYAKQTWPNLKIVLYGQSMGGVAILRSIAVHNTNPDAVVIESTYDRTISTVENRFTSMGIPSFPMAELLVFWGGWQSGFNAFKHNPIDYASSVIQPTLVLHGLLDPRVTEDQASAVYDQLSGWKKYSTYSKAGHVATLASDSMQWRQDINEIIDAVSPR